MILSGQSTAVQKSKLLLRPVKFSSSHTRATRNSMRACRELTGVYPGWQIPRAGRSSKGLLKRDLRRPPLPVSSQWGTTGQGQVVAKKESITLLNFDTGTPALLYRKYGKGSVIEWSTEAGTGYMTADEADTITYWLITNLLPAGLSVAPTTLPETHRITNPPANDNSDNNANGNSHSAAIVRNVTVHSSPPGASILIDGVYQGTTPSTVSGVNQGNHIIRLALSGSLRLGDHLYHCRADNECLRITSTPEPDFIAKYSNSRCNADYYCGAGNRRAHPETRGAG